MEGQDTLGVTPNSASLFGGLALGGIMESHREPKTLLSLVGTFKVTTIKNGEEKSVSFESDMKMEMDYDFNLSDMLVSAIEVIEKQTKKDSEQQTDKQEE